VLQQLVPSVSLNFHIGKPNAEHCMSEVHSEYSIILVDNKKLREMKLHIVQLFRTLTRGDSRFFFYEDVRCKKLLFFLIENLFGDLEQIGVESEYTETSCARTLLLHIIFFSV
jgi:hypothetical protein